MVADAVVLAGGMGTRLREVTKGILPKVLVPVLGRPFIDYKLRSLAKLGISRVTMLIGERADRVIEHVGDGSQFGVAVDYVADGPQLLGTAGAIRAASVSLPEQFWVTYGDTLVSADLAIGEQKFDDPTIEGVMAVLHNRDWLEPSNVDVGDGLVRAYRKNPPPATFQWIDYGLLAFRRSVFDDVDTSRAVDLSEVLSGMVERQSLAALEATQRFWEIGSPAALAGAETHFAAVGMWESLQ